MDTIALRSDPRSWPLGQLVRAARRGNRHAQGELVARYEPAIYRLALRRLGNEAEAQELTQEVFLRALTRLDQLQTPEAFGGWIRAITVRLAINRIVRRPRTVDAGPEWLDATLSSSATPLEQVLAGERAAQVREGLGRLGRMDRETLEAYYLRGQTVAEISDRLETPIGTIKRRLHVARKRLAKQLVALAI